MQQLFLVYVSKWMCSTPWLAKMIREFHQQQTEDQPSRTNKDSDAFKFCEMAENGNNRIALAYSKISPYVSKVLALLFTISCNEYPMR